MEGRTLARAAETHLQCWIQPKESQRLTVNGESTGDEGTMSDISYVGNLLRDFALAPFLDKFAYRNPKTLKKIKSGKVLPNDAAAREESRRHSTLYP